MDDCTSRGSINAKVKIASVKKNTKNKTNKNTKKGFHRLNSACLRQVSGHVDRGDTVLDLGVGDGAMLLSKMQTELTLVAEVQVAFFTMVGLFSRVYAQVALQSLQVTEARSTDLTRVWLLTRVDQHVGTQMSNLYKTSSTCLTFVWLLS